MQDNEEREISTSSYREKVRASAHIRHEDEREKEASSRKWESKKETPRPYEESLKKRERSNESLADIMKELERDISLWMDKEREALRKELAKMDFWKQQTDNKMLTQKCPNQKFLMIGHTYIFVNLIVSVVATVY